MRIWVWGFGVWGLGFRVSGSDELLNVFRLVRMFRRTWSYFGGERFFLSEEGWRRND